MSASGGAVLKLTSLDTFAGWANAPAGWQLSRNIGAFAPADQREICMTTRRELLKAGALLAAGGAARALAAESSPKTLLILGGTGFIGPHLTHEAQHGGWRVTHFNRGKTAAEGMSGVESLVGDRKGQLDALRGRKWDVVIDDTGYIPK